MARALSPVIGVVALVAVTVIGVAAVGAAVPSAPAEPPPLADLGLEADADSDTVAITHVSGEPLDVADLRLEVTVAGEPLARQPPVPFFAARGFESGPTGPFNHAGGTDWRAGQRGTLTIASTNGPRPEPGDTVTVTVATDRGVIAELSATAT